MAFKKKKKGKNSPQLLAQRTVHKNTTAQNPAKIGAEVQVFTARPSFAATGVTELHTPKHAAYSVRAERVRGPLAALDDLCHSGDARSHTHTKNQNKTKTNTQ